MSADAFYLKQVNISICIAKAEDILPFGMLRNGLNNAVLSQESVARRQLRFRRAFTISLIEQQRTSWKTGSGHTHTHTHTHTQMDTNIMSMWCRHKSVHHQAQTILDCKSLGISQLLLNILQTKCPCKKTFKKWRSPALGYLQQHWDLKHRRFTCFQQATWSHNKDKAVLADTLSFLQLLRGNLQ